MVIEAPVALWGDIEAKRLGRTLLGRVAGGWRWLMAAGKRSVERVGTRGGGAGSRSAPGRINEGTSPWKSSISQRHA